ncbi:hypothetical protein [Burkholderia pyrrocinia]|uniref:hypothetical protein n=1 Tax=Burkholderia pyrrocinia TaxID=60550 RepID=UPI0015771DCA|nr:hypothetical protein [Burkholderia pyrrocinia]
MQDAATRNAGHANCARVDAAVRARGCDVSLEDANASFAMHATCLTTSMPASIPSPLSSGRCVATRNNCDGVQAHALPASQFDCVDAIAVGDETRGTSVGQGFGETAKFGPPAARMKIAHARPANSRFRYSGKP